MVCVCVGWRGWWLRTGDGSEGNIRKFARAALVKCLGETTGEKSVSMCFFLSQTPLPFLPRPPTVLAASPRELQQGGDW